VDEARPLDSALALSTPLDEEGENGFLQASEVIDALSLDADLVTLSACETALGRNVGGEGILGLTRAFQIAGARSVLASLWSVGDESTSLLMKAFYGALADGASRGEALRTAQLRLLGNPETEDPFAWSGFELNGDPR
jgi:CHAT domain-containing protein